MPRDRTIASVKTPLAFFALALLVTEGLLAVLVTKAHGTDFTLLVVGMLQVLLVLILCVFYMLFRERPVPAEEFTDILVGIIDEYRSTVEYVVAHPIQQESDDSVIGKCSGLVNTVDSFRRFSLALEKLLNGQIDDLRGYVNELRGRDRFRLTQEDRQRLNAILVGINTSLPGKIREAELEEARIHALLRERRQRRTDTRRGSQA